MSNAAYKLEDDPETTQLRAAVEEARAETDSIPHERVWAWLLAPARGKRPPAPRP